MRAHAYCAMALGVALAALGGCRTEMAPCRPGTLFVELSFPAASGVQSVSVTVSSAAGEKVVDGSLPVPVGRMGGSVQIDLGAARYRAGTEVRVDVLGMRSSGDVVVSGTQTLVLAKGCHRAAVTLVPPEGDASPGRDGPPGDAGTADATRGGGADAVDGPRPGDDGPAPSDRGGLDGPGADVKLPDASCTGACAPGQRGTCGRCGTRVCSADCTWGACTDEGVCQAGEDRTCGKCGRERCADNCRWSGTCTGEGTCAAGASEACGACGTRTCSATCTWNACSGEGSCSSGQTRGCGKCGTERCGAGGGCGWTGRCENEGACAPGETKSCGNCGIERCGTNCQWSGACESQGSCAPGATQRCGRCNLGTQTCTNSCSWGATCSGDAVGCNPGDRRACGRCNLGSQTCSSSCTWGTCQGDTGCAPGTSGECGRCGTRSCSTSCEWSACNEPPICGCQNPLADSWSYTLTASSTPWRMTWGNPAIDSAANSLRLTYDDVVARSSLSGGFVVSFELRFRGDITFHPDMGSQAARYPAVKRTGTQLELGGLFYGSGTPWGTFGAWTGQTLTADRVEYTYYVRASSREIAARIRAGNAVHKTGFVSFATINPTILQLVGGNSNGVHDELGVDVGPITGCAGMTDTAVTSAYNQ